MKEKRPLIEKEKIPDPTVPNRAHTEMKRSASPVKKPAKKENFPAPEEFPLPETFPLPEEYALRDDFPYFEE